MLLWSSNMPQSLTVHHESSALFSLAFIADKLVTIVSNNTAINLDVTNGLIVGFSSDGKALACVSRNGFLHILCLPSGVKEQIIPIPIIHEDVVALIPLEQHSKWVIVTCFRIVVIRETVREINYSTIAKRRDPMHAPTLVAASRRADGRLFMIDSCKNIAEVTFDDATSTPHFSHLSSLASPTSHCTAAALSPDGELICVIDNHRSASVLHLKSQLELLRVAAPRVKAMREDTDLLCACFSLNSRELYISSEQGEIRVYSCGDDLVASWTLCRIIATEYPTYQGEYARAANELVASPDGVMYVLDDGIYEHKNAKRRV